MSYLLYTSDKDEDEEQINNEIENQRHPTSVKRVIRPRINFSFMYTSSFKERFRLAPSTAEHVLSIIGPFIKHKTMRNHALTEKQQLLVALHFFGSGSQYHCVGDMHGINASTVCRIINRVCGAIIRTMFSSIVRWPSTNLWTIPIAFSAIAGFPRVAGKYR